MMLDFSVSEETKVIQFTNFWRCNGAELYVGMVNMDLILVVVTILFLIFILVRNMTTKFRGPVVESCLN